MEFGIFAQAHVPQFELDADWTGAEHERLLREVELAVEGEKVGFKYVWASEHHFLQEYSHMSAPEVFLSWIGALTSTMHLGSAIFNTTPPVNHPARVAERAAMLDQLSGGRFEFCTGRVVVHRAAGLWDPEQRDHQAHVGRDHPGVPQDVA